MQAILLEAVDHPADDVIGMRAEAKNRVDRRQAERLTRPTAWGRCLIETARRRRLTEGHISQVQGGHGSRQPSREGSGRRTPKKHPARKCA
jgi:hypothetical protein